jgi:nucleoside-diphosphate-sugar epimerase
MKRVLVAGATGYLGSHVAIEGSRNEHAGPGPDQNQ